MVESPVRPTSQVGPTIVTTTSASNLSTEAVVATTTDSTQRKIVKTSAWNKM